MEPTASDPEVQQQYGMTVGIPNAGQLRAMGMLNIRGERTVTCKGACDRKEGRPGTCPKVCSELAKLPDALERAAELDAQYGRKPDLAKLPMYCIPFSFKDPFDTMDMRSTGGGDTRYDIDFPARDQTLVAQLRAKGAIIYAKANTTEYNGRGGNPGGKNYPTKVLPSTLGYQRSTWAGNPSNSYDTTRAASIGSSSGSGVSVGANLVMCSSVRGDRRLVPRAVEPQLGGAHPAAQVADLVSRRIDWREHLPGSRRDRLPRPSADSAKVLDALKDPVNGYYDPRDIFTTVPRSSVLCEPYAKQLAPGDAGLAEGHAHRDHARVHDQAREGRRADRRCGGRGNEARAGASISAPRSSRPRRPGWVDDPEVENMKVSFDQALAQIAPVLYPEILVSAERPDGEPLSRISRRRSSPPSSPRA